MTDQPKWTGSPVARDPLQAGLYVWIWHHSRLQQIGTLALIAASLPFYFFALDLPKQIVNGPIQGTSFPTLETTRTFFALAPWLPQSWSLREWPILQGWAFDRWQTLAALSALFLALVIVNGAFKFKINIAKGRLGEQMLRRLRLELVDRTLRLSPHRARTVRGSEVASIIKDEVEPIGGFIGDAFATPMFLLGQATIATLFILLQSMWLGCAALAVVALQAVVIPRLRQRLLVLGRERQLAARELSGRVGEVVDGLLDVQSNGAQGRERAEIEGRLAAIYDNRYTIYRRKFAIKFLNNSLAQVPPLFFFFVGGWLVMRGALDIGQLVAVIVAYRDLPGPIKELIDWDQQRQDAEVQFEQIVKGFPAPDPEVTAPGDGGGAIAPVTFADVQINDAARADRIEGLTLEVRPGEFVAAVGEPGSGATAVAGVLAGLAAPSAGVVAFAGSPQPARSRVALAGEDPAISMGTLREALLYGVPLADREQVAGSTLLDVLSATGLATDVLELALRTRIDAIEFEEVARVCLDARQRLAVSAVRDTVGGAVSPFDMARYNASLSIGDNLVHGRIEGTFDALLLVLADPQLQAALATHDLRADLAHIGRRMISSALELYGDLEPTHPFRREQRLLPTGDFALWSSLLKRDDEPERNRLAAVAIGYIEPRHRLGLLDDALRQRIVAARRNYVAPANPAAVPAAVRRLEPTTYCTALSLEENIVYGSFDLEVADGPRRVREAIAAVLAELGGTATILDVGLKHATGPAGRAFTLAQRQRIGLARALLRRPELLVVDRAIAANSQSRQTEIARRVLAYLERSSRARPTVYWVTGGSTIPAGFDRILEFRDGRLIGERTAADEPDNHHRRGAG